MPINCEPNTDECKKNLSDEKTIKYKATPGLIQHAQVETETDIGELATVKFTEVIPLTGSKDPKGWKPSFIKINSNDMKTGLGSGIYYIDPDKREFGGPASLTEHSLCSNIKWFAAYRHCQS